jgi:hypothetical protein
VPLSRDDPDLGVESDGADGLFFEVLDTQLEEEARDGGELENFCTLYPEIQLRHGMLSEFRTWFSSLGCHSSSIHISRRTERRRLSSPTFSGPCSGTAT